MPLTVIAEFREQLLQLVWWRGAARRGAARRLPLLAVLRNLLKGKTLVSEQERKSGRNAL